MASLVAQTVKRLPVTRETQVQSLGQEDPLEQEMATHSPVFPRKFHEQRSWVGYSSWGYKRVGYDLATKLTTKCKHQDFHKHEIKPLENSDFHLKIKTQ